MIDIGDLIEYDSPHSTTKTIGIVTNVIEIGGFIVTVNFGAYEEMIFGLDNVRKIA